MAEDKTPVTKTSKVLIFALVAAIAVIIILVLSGFNKINPLLLLLTLLAVAGFIYYSMRKPKFIDIYEMQKILKEEHYIKSNSFLDFRGMQVIPVTESITHFYLPYEGRTFEFRQNRIMGIQTRHILKVIKEQEKSRLFESAQKASSASSQLKQTANILNVDPTSIGLE